MDMFNFIVFLFNFSFSDFTDLRVNYFLSLAYFVHSQPIAIYILHNYYLIQNMHNQSSSSSSSSRSGLQRCNVNSTNQNQLQSRVHQRSAASGGQHRSHNFSPDSSPLSSPTDYNSEDELSMSCSAVVFTIY